MDSSEVECVWESSKLHCTPKDSTPYKVKERGYLYSRPPLHNPGNTPTCPQYTGNILGLWTFPEDWSIQVGYYYRITLLTWCRRSSPPSTLQYSRVPLPTVLQEDFPALPKVAVRLLGLAVIFGEPLVVVEWSQVAHGPWRRSWRSRGTWTSPSRPVLDLRLLLCFVLKQEVQGGSKQLQGTH